MNDKINELWLKAYQPVEAAWAGLSAKDQRALLVLAIVVLPLLFISLFWWPSFSAKKEASAQYSQNAALLSRLQVAAPQLRQNTGVGSKPSLAELPSRVQQLAQAQSLTVTKVEPDNTGITVNMTGVVMVSLVRFLEQCKQQGMQVDELIISKDGESFQAKFRILV
ncbi:MAG: type II secretion system protein GspM [Moraxellaceae bacterium]|nr:type II secretion system protein GspM [Moraxellaceae bacterium]MDP1776315.1 type II secretion system protein GspM [Moraxellaceae bacterium]